MRRNAAGCYVAIVFIVSAVADGWSGRPSPWLHQILLLPFTIGFTVGLGFLLTAKEPLLPGDQYRSSVPLRGVLWASAIFELFSVAVFLYERNHFLRFGYVLGPVRLGALVIVAAAAAGAVVWRPREAVVLGAGLLVYGAGLLLAIVSFPLNYLRSDMLPVIRWADERLLHGLDPYVTMHVGSRLYDFPYLPGMLIAYLPAVAAHLDLRFLNLACVVALALLLYSTSVIARRLDAAALIVILLLSPFLQYRHDLYLAPHWLALTGALVLMKRRDYAWAAAVFGLSMAIYQLSWVLFPFFLLNAFRRRGWREAVKLGVSGAAGMLAIVGPFLAEATRRIANNTVGQWSKLPHAIADPINLSYWLTFVVRPDQLKWVQLAVMAALFFYCVLRGRCGTTTDTLRWMSGALTLFIALNVLVDGYFYLTLLVLLLIFTLCVTGIWEDCEHPAGPLDSAVLP